MKTLDTVIQTIEKHRLIQSGDRILIALSGGPDSVALTQLLHRLRRRYRLQLGAVYINHQLRPRAAVKEEKFCQTLCDRLGIPLTIIRENIPARAKRERKGIEETARDFRYETFATIAVSENYARIALGHHIDDRVETVLFRIVRGTGLTGLAGIPVKRGKMIRPLYDLSKADILEYLRRNRFTWCEDLSNDHLAYDRNFIRHELLPLLRKRLNRSVDRAILNLSETTTDEAVVIEAVVTKAVRRVVAVSPGGKVLVRVETMHTYDKWLRYRILRACFALLGEEMPDREVIVRLDQLLSGARKALSLPHQLRATVVNGTLVLYRPTPKWQEKSVGIGRITTLGIGGLRLHARLTTESSSIPKKQRLARKVGLDWRKISPPLVVRPIQAGDRFQPLGLDGTKKVGDFLTDRKLPSIYRDEIPAVCDRHGIIWLGGCEIAERVKRSSKTKEVLILEIVGNKKGVGKTV